MHSERDSIATRVVPAFLTVVAVGCGGRANATTMTSEATTGAASGATRGVDAGAGSGTSVGTVAADSALPTSGDTGAPSPGDGRADSSSMSAVGDGQADACGQPVTVGYTVDGLGLSFTAPAQFGLLGQVLTTSSGAPLGGPSGGAAATPSVCLCDYTCACILAEQPFLCGSGVPACVGDLSSGIFLTCATQQNDDAMSVAPEASAAEDAQPSSEAGSIDSGATSLRVQAYIDGRSDIVVSPAVTLWRHFDFDAPGRWNGATDPTILNTLNWFPTWPDVPDGLNTDCNCESSSIATPVAVPLVNSVSVTVNAARGAIAIIQHPSQDNGYQTILEFNDDPMAGAAWYDVTLLWQ
jgi:hypothetical protein